MGIPLRRKDAEPDLCDFGLAAPKAEKFVKIAGAPRDLRGNSAVNGNFRPFDILEDAQKESMLIACSRTLGSMKRGLYGPTLAAGLSSRFRLKWHNLFHLSSVPDDCCIQTQ